jgi:hypothetical protein
MHLPNIREIFISLDFSFAPHLGRCSNLFEIKKAPNIKGFTVIIFQTRLSIPVRHQLL